MATDLITIDQACQHLRLDADTGGGADASWLGTFIPAICEAVSAWVKDDARLYVPEIDSSGMEVFDSAGEPIPDQPLTVRPIVQAAVLVELESQYRFRSGDADNAVSPDAGYGYVLNKASTALLQPLRKTTVR
jgi:hypothetical protein